MGDGPGLEGQVRQGHSGEQVPSSSGWHHAQAGGDGADNLMPRKEDVRLSNCDWVAPILLTPRLGGKPTPHNARVWLLPFFGSSCDSTL